MRPGEWPAVSTTANALSWTFPSTGPYSTGDLIAALRGGQLFVSIDSANFPSGRSELTLRRSELPSSGVFFYRLQTGAGEAGVGKVVVWE